MSKFNVGDRFQHIIEDNPAGVIDKIHNGKYYVTWDHWGTDTYDISIGDAGWEFISHKNQVIDQMNDDASMSWGASTLPISLAPGEIWAPQATTEVKETICIHTWRHITLFTSTVEECSKCGKLRDE